MSNQPSFREQKDKQGAIQVVGIKAGLTALIALLLLPFSADKALAWLLGGSIAAACNGWFTWKVFGSQLTDDPQKELGKMFAAEIGKILLIAVCFGLVFKTAEPMRDQQNALVMFSGFLLVYLQSLIAPRLMRWL